MELPGGRKVSKGFSGFVAHFFRLARASFVTASVLKGRQAGHTGDPVLVECSECSECSHV